MKKVAIYILAVVSLCLASCISLEESFISTDQGGQNLKIMASVADFSNVKVGTKALEEEDSKVNEITMLIFDSNNKIVGRPVNLHGANSIFMIDTQNAQIIDGVNPPIDMVGGQVTQATLDACSIYMVANCWHVLESETISTLNDLLTVDIPVEAIGIPKSLATSKLLGIPMIGSEEGFDLSSNRSSTASTLADIVMEKLYAKVNVRFQVNSNQVIKIPSFTLTEWTVSNIPNAVRLREPIKKGEPAPTTETAHASGTMLQTTKGSNVLSHGITTIKHSESAANPEYFQFTFYVPEHRVNPKNSFPYPPGIHDDEKQRYKPLLCKGQKPMYVTVNGIYSDHHGQVKEVTYSLYLGQNNSDDFHVRGNQELTNVITITGLTNSKPDNDSNTNISVDHRVEVTSDSGYSIAVEREALLDSHFEVRPMDVFVSNGGKVVLTVNSTSAPNDGDDWLRIEKSYKSSPATHIEGVGVRNYFTANLVRETLNNEQGRTITITENSRIWLYFDENTGVYDKTVPEDHPHSKKFRDITLTVDYYADKNSDVITESQDLSFRQINLWRVRNADNTRYYDIEYHEEYLYNYASDDNYGKRTDGMAWGLDGLQVSGSKGNNSTQAFAYDSGYSSGGGLIGAIIGIIVRIIEAIVNGSISNKPYYDFYNTQAEAISAGLQGTNGQYHPYSGYDFCAQIIDAANNDYIVDTNGNITETPNTSNDITTLLLNESPQSAVEYCYNKNKRHIDNTGTVKTINWYLPAIDEIEEIAMGAYQDFEVFQNKFYWSSQPAYTQANWRFFYGWTYYTGKLYYDNINYARATKVAADATGKFSTVKSGMSNPNETWTLYEDDIPDIRVDNNITPIYDLGYRSRTALEDYSRIRCVYRSGLVSEIDN